MRDDQLASSRLLLRAQSAWAQWSLHCATVAVLFSTAASLARYHVLGSPDIVMACLREADCVAFPSAIDIGKCAPEDLKEVRIRVRNLALSPIVITGMKRSCRCILTESLPMHVAGGSVVDLIVTAKFGEAVGPFSLTAVLYTTSVSCPRLPLVFNGTMVHLGFSWVGVANLPPHAWTPPRHHEPRVVFGKALPSPHGLPRESSERRKLAKAAVLPTKFLEGPKLVPHVPSARLYFASEADFGQGLLAAASSKLGRTTVKHHAIGVHSPRQELW